MDTLSSKRLRFVEEYLIDLNGTQAAIRAGFSSRTASVTASRLLTDDRIARAIADSRKRLSERLEITAETVLQELAKIGFATVSDFFSRDSAGKLVVNDDALLDRNKAAAIAQIDVQTGADGSQSIKLKLAEKKGALVELGKHLGLFVEKPPIMVPEQKKREDDPRFVAMAVYSILREAEAASMRIPLQIQGD